MASFHRLCRFDEVPEGRAKPFEVDGLPVALLKRDGEVFALYGRCPHANGSLGLGWLEEGEAVCPLHRWRFKLETGRCTTVRGESVHRFRCEIRGDDVYVEV